MLTVQYKEEIKAATSNLNLLYNRRSHDILPLATHWNPRAGHSPLSVPLDPEVAEVTFVFGDQWTLRFVGR
jgi:hypothetical protein